jgi:hypothetical protein
VYVTARDSRIISRLLVRLKFLYHCHCNDVFLIVAYHQRCFILSCVDAVDEAVVAMLDSGNRELVFVACGVLINLMVDEEKRPMLIRHNGVVKYVMQLALLTFV